MSQGECLNLSQASSFDSQDNRPYLDRLQDVVECCKLWLDENKNWV